jgi:hypothetical protein
MVKRLAALAIWAWLLTSGHAVADCGGCAQQPQGSCTCFFQCYTCGGCRACCKGQAQASNKAMFQSSIICAGSGGCYDPKGSYKIFLKYQDCLMWCVC